ncbi:MAG: type II secretion system F family protein [Planctomycetota bacterium]|nr:MAG: type II secretion system F family protein [Planctomycetota bacterium]
MAQSAPAQARSKPANKIGVLAKLHSIQIGGGKAGSRINKADLIYIIRNLATLVANGVALPKALHTLSHERSLQKYADMLDTIRRKVAAGESFSKTLALFPETFSSLLINHVRVGERAGTLPSTLVQITEQLETSDNLKRAIVKKLAYPIMLTVVGTLAVTFMLLFVVPIFEETYAETGVPLPLVTRFMIGSGAFLATHGWWLFLLGLGIVFGVRYARRNPDYAYLMDRQLLHLPLFGDWLRDIAVLQFMEVLGNMLEAGFTMVDALRISAGSVGNYAVKRSVEELQSAVTRGERFSRELERHGELFPPVVSQLVIVGEQTGTVPKATADVRQHLKREIERKTSLLVGTIEPILTIGLASMIGCILLAIYLPMFDMIGAMNPGH